MRRDLDETSVLHQRDAVGSRGRGEAVGDRDHRTALRDCGQRALDGCLRRRIQARRRLVEDDHRRIGERDARDADELALTGREPQTTRLHVRAETVRQRLEPVERADAAQRAADVVVRRVGMREADVLGDRAGEEVALLWEEHDPPA